MTDRPTNCQKYEVLKGPRAFRSVKYVYLMNKTEIIYIKKPNNYKNRSQVASIHNAIP